MMIKPQIIKENNKPKAVIMDYKEYMRLKELAEDKSDYYEALEAELFTKKLTNIKDVKKKLKIK